MPIKWTLKLPKNFMFSGIWRQYDQFVVQGEVENDDYIGFYCKNNQIIGAGTMGNKFENIALINRA